MMHRDVFIRLLKNKKTLEYFSIEKTTLWSYIKGPTKISLDSIKSILYGGTSMTFKMHRAKVIQKLRAQRKHYTDQEFGPKQAIFEDCANYDDSEISEGDENLNDGDSDIFHSWECVSFIRKNGTTLDLRMKDHNNLLALIHVVYKHVYEPIDTSFLTLYRILKCRMKVAYEAYMQRISIKDVLLRAIFKTLL